MIKALMQARDGTTIALIGLSGENVTRLVADEPVVLDLADFGLPAQRIAIVYGRTEQAIIEDIRTKAVNAIVTLPPDV